MRYRIKKRLRLAHHIKGKLSTRSALPSIHQAIHDAMYIVAGEMEFYKMLFSEEMPWHYKHAVSLEIEIWINLRNALDTIMKPNLPGPEYEGKARYYRALLETLMLIERMQLEMLTSPLVQKYESELKEIEAKLKRK